MNGNAVILFFYQFHVEGKELVKNEIRSKDGIVLLNEPQIIIRNKQYSAT